MTILCRNNSTQQKNNFIVPQTGSKVTARQPRITQHIFIFTYFNLKQGKTMHNKFDEIIDRTNTLSIKWAFPNSALPDDITRAPLPLWVADMDFRCPQPVLDALGKAVEHGIFGYSDYTAGMDEAVSQWQLQEHQWKIDPQWILHSPGVVCALSFIIQTFTQPGDSVLILTPVYGPFRVCPSELGRNVIEVELTEQNHAQGGNYVFDPEKMEQAINMIIKK